MNDSGFLISLFLAMKPAITSLSSLMEGLSVWIFGLGISNDSSWMVHHEAGDFTTWTGA